MAQRKPLVLNAGRVEQLQSADVLEAPSAVLTEASSAPLTVSSTALVTNLNADLLDGLHASDFTSVFASLTNDNAGAIVIGTPVYIKSNGNVDKAQANAEGASVVFGLVRDTSIASAASGDIQFGGELTATTGQWDAVTGGSGGLTPGPYYLSAATAGGLSTTNPDPANFSAPVGIAKSSTVMLIAPRRARVQQQDPPTLLCGGRISAHATIANPPDVTSATTVYFHPYESDRLALYSNSRWAVHSFSTISLALTATVDKNYDVFAYFDTSTSTIKLELSAAWTNNTTRADALTRLNGVLVKNSDNTRRFLGTIRASAANTITDTETQRFVWNMYNRVRKRLHKRVVLVSGATWTYGTNSWRRTNNDIANRVEIVYGDPNESGTVWLCAAVQIVLYALNVFGHCGIGEDTSAANSADISARAGGTSTAPQMPANCAGNFAPGIGYHFYQQTEFSEGGTVTYGSSQTTDTRFKAGLTGHIMA